MDGPPETLLVNTGAAGWLIHAPLMLAVVAGLGLLTAPTSTVAKLAALAALTAGYRICSNGWRRAAHPGRLQLFRDGWAILEQAGKEQHAEAAGSPWVTPWICVIPLKTAAGAAMMPCMVCASGNRPEDFRRLRVLLRLGSEHRARPRVGE